MFCTNCGHNNPDNVQFCENCGTPLSAQGGGAPVPAPASAVGTVKRVFSSGVFMTAAIALSAALLFKLVGAMFGGSVMMNMIQKAMGPIMAQISSLGLAGDEMAVVETVLQYLPMIFGGNTMTKVVSCLPMVFLLVSVWMVYAAAASRKNPGMGTAGLTMSNVYVILKMVGYCLSTLAAVAVEVLGIVAVAAAKAEVKASAELASSYGLNVADIPEIGAANSLVNWGMALFIGAIVVTIGIAVLVIMIYVKLFKSVGSVKRTAVSGQPDAAGVRKLPAVMLYICGICTMLGGLLTLFFGLFDALSNLGLGLFYVMVGATMFKYRKEMQFASAAPEMNMAPAFGNVPPIEEKPTAYPAYAPEAPQAPAAPVAPAFGEASKTVYSPEPPITPVPPVFTPSMDSGSTISETRVPDYTPIPQPAPRPALPRGRIIRRKTNESIYIDQPAFRIGKDSSACNYTVSDNPAVSRVHAIVIIKNGSFYLVDNNSTNHVTINGKMLQPGFKYKLANGYRFCLGNEEFMFAEG